MPADGERDPAPSLRASDSASAIDVDNVLAHEAPTRDLLEYYRSKVLAFAAEREQYLKRLETLERFASSSAAQPEGASRSTPEVRVVSTGSSRFVGLPLVQAAARGALRCLSAVDRTAHFHAAGRAGAARAARRRAAPRGGAREGTDGCQLCGAPPPACPPRPRLCISCERAQSLRLQVTVDELTTELMVARRQRGAPQQPVRATAQRARDFTTPRRAMCCTRCRGRSRAHPPAPHPRARTRQRHSWRAASLAACRRRPRGGRLHVPSLSAPRRAPPAAAQVAARGQTPRPCRTASRRRLAAPRLLAPPPTRRPTQAPRLRHQHPPWRHPQNGSGGPRRATSSGAAC